MHETRLPSPRDRKVKIARLIARDFERLSFDRPDAVMIPGYTWENIERLAHRLELLPEDLAALLVLESSGCTVLDSASSFLAARPASHDGGLN